MKTKRIEMSPDFVPGDIVGWPRCVKGTGSLPACDRAEVIAADRRTVTVQAGGEEFTMPADVPDLVDRPVSYFKAGDLVWREDMTAVMARMHGVAVVEVENSAVVVDYYGERRRYTAEDLREKPLVKIASRKNTR
jgi:hypothetical protein